MKKLFSLFVALVIGIANLAAASGVDWSQYSYLGDGAGGGAYSNLYKVQTADGLNIVNIQQPGWAAEPGIYCHVSAAITSCSVDGAIDGAGMVMYLSSFTAKETQVTIVDGTAKEYTFWVLYENGTEEGGEEGGDDGEGGNDGPTPDIPTPTAEKYVVWSGDALADGEEQIPVEYNHWWNNTIETIEDADSPEGYALKITSTDGSAASSFGYLLNGAGFNLSYIVDMDLVFYAKVEGDGNWICRLTSPDADQPIEILADGAYHKVRYNIRNHYANIVSSWSTGEATTGLFVFAAVGENLTSASALKVADIHYEAAVPMPEVNATVSNVTAASADLEYAVTFPDGYSNTKVTINGEDAEASATLNLIGLSAKTKYTYVIVASGEYNGETYTTEEVVEFTTQREAGDEPVWYGITDKEGFYSIYNITYNVDKTLTVQATFDTEMETVVADRNFHIYVNGAEWLKLYDEDGDEIHTGTTTSTFEEGAVLTWEWYLPYAGGVYQETNQYTVGSANEPIKFVVLPRISAAAQNVTYNSAEIAYEVTLPEIIANAEDVKVYYQVGEGEPVLTEASPIIIEGLTENTEYTYSVYAVATLEGETLESLHAEVTFKTPYEDAVDLVYADYANVEFKNAYFIGEDASMARSIFASLPWKVTFRADATAVYEIDLSQVENIVGLNPQIYWNGFKQLTKNAETGWWEYDFGAQTVNAEVAISHYLAYAGGVYDYRTPYTAYGMEQAMPELGEATQLALSASKQYVLVGERVTLSTVAKDAAGHYLPSDDIEYSATEGVVIEGSFVTLSQRGEATITAQSGSLSASVVVTAIASVEAVDIASGVVGETDVDYVMGGTAASATDGNEGSELQWNCTETQEHYLTLDITTADNPDGFYIETVDLLFEGAYATKFTVTLSNINPQAAISAYAAADDVVFENTKNDTRHIFTQNPTGTHKYVTVNTTEALNAGWGIKIKEIKVYGTTKDTTGIDGIIDDNATEQNVEVIYNLNGVRVSDTVPGHIYIVNGKKTLVK